MPTQTKIRFCVPEFDVEDTAALMEVLATRNFAGNGSVSKRVERQLASIAGTRSAVLTPSCSAALEMAARLLDLKPGDEVIVPSYAFVTTASSFVWNGARPVFADVDPVTLSLTPETIERRVTRRTKAIVVLHYGGMADDVQRLKEFCDAREFVLIEDNAHGLGASRDGQPLGSFGLMSTLSFHQTKNVTCGEGGALLLGDELLLARALILQEKGTDRAQFAEGKVDRYTWRDVGSSWVLSDLLSSLLGAQLSRLGEITSRRLSIWRSYLQGLREWADAQGVLLGNPPDAVGHTGHLFFLRFPNGLFADQFSSHMLGRGVEVASHYQALNRSPMGLRFGGLPGDCPVAEAASLDLVRLPMHTSLSDANVSHVIEAACDFVPGLRRVR